ncbi:unnamed protein product [Blepharisma stoltei]|uniref:CCHC-type domain-containing protein n=1 Tax=Blepharisma stoltei TaxID=1481888 RepID=A0AAU9JGW8_9CILI|nr:unnamed protein product [Blepharisma stoltei]
MIFTKIKNPEKITILDPRLEIYPEIIKQNFENRAPTEEELNELNRLDKIAETIKTLISSIEINPLSLNFKSNSFISPRPLSRLEKRCFQCGESCHSLIHCKFSLCLLCNKIGHLASRCIFKNYPDAVMSIKQCEFCDLRGHHSSDCLNRKNSIESEEFSEITCIVCRSHGHINCLNNN